MSSSEILNKSQIILLVLHVYGKSSTNKINVFKATTYSDIFHTLGNGPNSIHLSEILPFLKVQIMLTGPKLNMNFKKTEGNFLAIYIHVT